MKQIHLTQLQEIITEKYSRIFKPSSHKLLQIEVLSTSYNNPEIITAPEVLVHLVVEPKLPEELCKEIAREIKCENIPEYRQAHMYTQLFFNLSVRTIKRDLLGNDPNINQIVSIDKNQILFLLKENVRTVFTENLLKGYKLQRRK